MEASKYGRSILGVGTAGMGADRALIVLRRDHRSARVASCYGLDAMDAQAGGVTKGKPGPNLPDTGLNERLMGLEPPFAAPVAANGG